MLVGLFIVLVGLFIVLVGFSRSLYSVRRFAEYAVN